MADVFISYSKDDRALAESLARMFERNGLTVWWDTSLLPGDAFRNVILRELKAARAVVVIWTTSSVSSEWVQAEADLARKKLVPVIVPELRKSEVPPPFSPFYSP